MRSRSLSFKLILLFFLLQELDKAFFPTVKIVLYKESLVFLGHWLKFGGITESFIQLN